MYPGDPDPWPYREGERLCPDDEQWPGAQDYIKQSVTAIESYGASDQLSKDLPVVSMTLGPVRA